MSLQVDRVSQTQKEISFSGSQLNEEAVIPKILCETIN